MIRVWKSEVRKLLRPRFIISNFAVVIILQLSLTVTMMLKAKGDIVQDLNKASGLFMGTKTIAAFLGIISFCLFAANFADGGSKDLSYLHSASVTSGYAFLAIAILLLIFNLRDVAN